MFGRRIERGNKGSMAEKLDFPSLGRLYSLTEKYRPILLLAIIIVAISGALELVAPYVLQFVVDAIFTQKDSTLLLTMTLIVMSSFLVQSLFYFFRSYLLGTTGEKIIASLRINLFSHLQFLPLSYFNQKRTGELVSRLSNDVTTVRSILTSDLASALAQVISLIGAIILIIGTNWRLTLFMLALVPILVIISGIYGRRIRKLSTQVQDTIADSTTVLEESLSNHKIVQSFVREEYEIKRYTNAINESLKIAFKKIKTSSLFTPLLSFFGFCSVVGVFWFGGNEVLEGRLSAGQLVTFLALTFTVAGALGRLASVFASLQEASGATKRLFEILDTQSEIRESENPKKIDYIEGNISIKNLNFAYSDKTIIKDLNLDIKAGELIALVGPSGAGKTSLLHIIPRFYESQANSIFIDSISVEDFSLSDLRKNIGLVPQETFLFGGTIRENILYGRPDATHDEIVKAARAAHAEEFIDLLTNGYDTVIGERGVKLSGGQRQRVSIARAILKNPRILLLDEATSSLDNESEAIVQGALDQLMKGRTSIVVAHRLSTIKKADRILVLDAGTIVESGTHEMLMVQGGLYKNLYDMQFRDQSV